MCEAYKIFYLGQSDMMAEIITPDFEELDEKQKRGWEAVQKFFRKNCDTLTCTEEAYYKMDDKKYCKTCMNLHIDNIMENLKL